MYRLESKDEVFPKTLIVRNEKGGMIWQVYHIQKLSEAEKLAYNAKLNQFEDVSVEDYREDLEETWPEWRETEGGKEIIK